MNLDKTPQKFNPKALAIAQELDKLTAPAGVMLDSLQRAQQLREEVREELKKQSKIMREIAEKGDEELDKLKEEAKKRVREVERMHEDIVDRIREAQPELKDIEFKIDVDEGTFTPTEKRALKPEHNAQPEQNVPPEVVDEIKKMVDDLMKRVSSK